MIKNIYFIILILFLNGCGFTYISGNRNLNFSIINEFRVIEKSMKQLNQTFKSINKLMRTKKIMK